MRYVAAYLLAVLGGKEQPTAEDVKKILGSVGAEVDETKLNKLLSEMKGKNLEEVLKAGRAKLSAVPAAPAGGAAAPASTGAPEGKGDKGGKKEKEKEAEKPKKEDKPKEPSEEPVAFDLFG